ncbi:N-carbamoylputrescine amidase [Desertimonas flava]|uniref:N-carbamoylputrescine amidase n=1 Tax=Desertimonas flava TaxID=2064846 RepID=UPI000E344F91|nr:N-carbamoylputrescine amidase [Desertimonas flava]
MELTVAAVQMAMVDDVAGNVATAERLVRDAAHAGARVILVPELFEGPYFCKDMLPEHFARAVPVDGHPTVEHFAKVAAELDVVLPLSIYERANNATYNSVVMVDADGSVLGTYRKSHLPDGPGYTEKYYFNPGDTGFRVWPTRYGRIGVGICWDQWFPESARCMALLGADVLFYPTAIGSEPPDPDWDSSGHWQRVMQGHAGANLTPLVAANRIGHEAGETTSITFYGSSFIADPTGAKVAEASRDAEGVITATFDLDAVRAMRHSWGLFRDRRPDLYGPLLTLDGTTAQP